MAGWRGAFRPVNWACLLQRHKHFDMKCSNNPAAQVAASVSRLLTAQPGLSLPLRARSAEQAALGPAVINPNALGV